MNTLAKNRARNQDIIEALQELNTLLDEEAQQQYDPEDKELWARVGNRIDTIDYRNQDQSSLKAINPAPSASTPLELVAPKIQDTDISSPDDQFSQVVNSKLNEFGIDSLSSSQIAELASTLMRELRRKTDKKNG